MGPEIFGTGRMGGKVGPEITYLYYKLNASRTGMITNTQNSSRKRTLTREMTASIKEREIQGHTDWNNPSSTITNIYQILKFHHLRPSSV